MQPSHDLMETSSLDDDKLRFRADTVENALVAARAELGDDVEVVEANRLRRGGVGGFFATDLGVEILVETPSDRSAIGETMHTPDVSDSAGEFIDPNAFVPLVAAPTTEIERPVFYDQVDEAEPSMTGDDEFARVIAAVNRAEQSARDGVVTNLTRQGEAELATNDPESFASHFERELATGPRPEPELCEPEPTGSTMPPQSDDVDLTGGHQIPILPRSQRSPSAGPIQAPQPIEAAQPQPILPVATAPEVNVSETLAIEPTVPAPSNPSPTRPEPAAKKSVPARRGSRRDPYKRPTELAATAVGSLVNQLSDLASVDGGLVQNLHRVSVSVTLPDGIVIEMAADMQGETDV